MASLASFEELVVGDVLQRGGDDLDVGRQLGLVQIGQPGDQLASGQVARRAEQHDDVRVDREVVVTVWACARRRIGDRLRLCLSPRSAYFHRRSHLLQGYGSKATATSQARQHFVTPESASRPSAILAAMPSSSWASPEPKLGEVVVVGVVEHPGREGGRQRREPVGVEHPPKQAGE